MHYHVDGKLIKSELAAKSPSQPPRALLRFLKDHDPVRRALDYGCGKLRYAGALSAMAQSLTLVDSPIQLARQQNIDGERTTVRELVRQKWPNAQIETICEFQDKLRPKFDFALCANVLSAIPSKTARSQALAAIKRRLKTSGSLLVVNQHTNSYYGEVARREDVVSHLDGWLVPTGGGASYYGIIDKDKAAKILQLSGYQLVEHWIEGQSNYALARIR